MMSSYNSGNNGNPIGFQVQIGTVGVALSDVHTSPLSGQWQRVSGIIEKDGDLARFTINKGASTEKLFVLLRTFIDFRLVDENLWPLAKQNVYAKYVVDGGQSGDVSFDYQSDDISTFGGGGKIVINKIIELL